MDSEPALARPRKLTAIALSGMGWSYSTTIAVAGIQAIHVAVMSRLVDPAGFGIYAIALLSINLGNSFARMGIAQALVQRPSITRDDVRAAATAGMVLGILLFMILWFLAPWIGRFFTEPDAVPIIRAMGSHFIFLGLGVTSQGLLRRALRFRELSIAHIASYAVGYGVIGISMAFLGAGVWSLAAGVIATHFLQAILQYAWVRHPLRPILQLRRFSSLYAFGTRISLVSFFEFLGRQLDTFAVGRYATTALLGQYSRAFVIVNLPLSQHLSQAITRVMFPSFSKIQSDLRRLRRAYLSVIVLGGMLVFAVGAGMALAAREIVLVALGEQWDVAIRLVPYFAIAVSFNIMTKFAELLCEARAELNKILGLQFCYLILLGSAYVAVSGMGGLVPFAATLAISEVLRHLGFMALAGRVLDIRGWEMIQAYFPGAVTAAAVAGTVFLARQTRVIDGFPVAGVLAVEVVMAAIALALSTWFNPVSKARNELKARLQAVVPVKKRRGPQKWLFSVLLGRDQ